VSDDATQATVADNTLVVLTADHGEQLGDHGIYFDHWGLQQSVLRVPLILAGPGVPSGLQVNERSMSLDILPTVLDLLHIQYQPDSFAGQSLVPLLRDHSSDPWQAHASSARFEDRAIFSENLDDLAVAVRQGRWFFQKELRDAIYSTRFSFSAGRVTLYDELSDPRDYQNVANEHPDVVRHYDELITHWLATNRHPQSRQAIDPSVRERLHSLGYMQ
jgi:arylsulfatase A-like enzyme